MNAHQQGARMRRQAPWRKQAGLSLVEVMIAMTIGLVMLGGVGYLFVSTKQMNSAQTDAVRVQESARTGMDVIGKAVRQAGYKLNNHLGVVLFDDPVDSVNGSGTGFSATSDVLILRHDPMWVRDTAVPPNPLLGREIDCQGMTVTSDNAVSTATGVQPVNTKLVVYRFYVASGKLMCSNDATGATPGVVVADNVENMQVTYGIGNGLESILSYTNNPTAAELTNVSAVRVSLLLKGPSPKVIVGTGQSVRFNGVTEVKNDGHLRRVVTSTFTMRNQSRKGKA